MILSRPRSATRCDCAPRHGASHPALVAWCLSAAAHAAVLVGLGAGTPSAARLAAFDRLEVMLASAAPAAAQPVPRSQPAPAVVPAAPAPVAAGDGRHDRGDDPDDSPRVEARHDVAAFNNPKPPYPLAARRRGLEGRVLLSAHVRADGHCAEVHVRTSSGHELLDAAALDTVRRWRFLPARRGDAAVDSWVEIPISFKLAS